MSEKPYRILIIEDSPEDREVYRRRIAQGREQDYLFWETGSGEEGLRLCREVVPDCVLLDYQLPDLDGLEFLDRFQAEAGGSDRPIVMLTGHGNEAVAVQAMKKGAHDYLVKGLDSDNLRSAIQAAIDKGLLRRQVDEQRRELDGLLAERLQLIADLQIHADALAVANRRKDEFLAMLAHELRNPLAPIYNSLELLRMLCPKQPDLEMARDVIDRQVQQMKRLIDDLLDVSRISRGKLELRRERVNLAAVVSYAIEASRPAIENGSHELTVKLPPDPIPLDADMTRLCQALVNLLNNAAKYTNPGGRIELIADREGDQVTIQVKDNGIGIPVDMLPRVFEMFTQVDSTLDRSQGGLGIGLTLARTLISLHGGTIEARSSGCGSGSEFIVRLPIVAMSDSQKVLEDNSTPAAGPASYRILIADDNLDHADSMAKLLRLSGHQVHLAHDGLAAVNLVLSTDPDIVLMDIGMPKMNGYEAARRIRERHGHELVLIALTGWGQIEDRSRATDAGFNYHLTKPVKYEVLEKLIAKSVPRRR